MHPLSRRLVDRTISALTTMHSLEIYSGVYAVVWGAVTMTFWHYLDHTNTEGLLPYVGGHGWLYGLWPLAWGVIGLWGIQVGRRSVRALSAQMNAVFWWCFAGWYYYVPDPSVTSQVVNYSLAALAEAWVYVRISQRFDDLTGATRHGGQRDRDHSQSD